MVETHPGKRVMSSAIPASPTYGQIAFHLRSVMWRPGKLRFLIGVKNRLHIQPAATAGRAPLARTAVVAGFVTSVGLRPPYTANLATFRRKKPVFQRRRQNLRPCIRRMTKPAGLFPAGRRHLS